MLKQIWILTIAVAVMMAIGFYHAALAAPYIQFKNGVILRNNVTIKTPGGGGAFECGTDTVDDGDGKSYNTVSIGGQCWMATNLEYDGNPSGGGCSTVTWSSSDVGACSYYTGGPYADEGLLYQWSAAQGKCPSGWRVPSDADYKTLEIYLGMCLGTDAGCVDATGWRGTTEGDEMKKAGLCEGRTPCGCLLYTSPSPRDATLSRMPSSA